MRHLASLVRFATATGLALALASACGGKSFNTGGDDDDDNGGTSQGGSTSRAGSRNVAGKAQGGTTAQGGSTSTAGTGNVGAAGGYAGEGCGAAPEGGVCDAYVPSWYHDPNTGICRPFVYGGCGGNANRYGSLAECQKACPGGTPNFDACTTPSDCMVTGTGCCGICDGPNISEHDLVAYNRQYAGALQCGVALDVAPPGSGAELPIACAPCPSIGGGTLKFFVPDCVQNQCVVTDLRESPLTACKTSTDCVLRYGTDCCQSCDSGDVFSLRKDANLEKLVCGDSPVLCPACAPQPNGAQANCSPQGRCEVVIPL